MTEPTCDNICKAAMAIFDGGPAELNSAAVEIHLAACPACREEIEQLTALAVGLSRLKRRQQAVDLWPVIRGELHQRQYAGKKSAWRPFFGLSALLLGYRILEIVPRIELSTVFKLIPVLAVIGVFYYLRENPFKVNPMLKLEGE